MVIQAIKDGVPAGYVRSVSYKHERFALVGDVLKAKTYTSFDRAVAEVDDLTRFGYHKGYVFTII